MKRPDCRFVRVDIDHCRAIDMIIRSGRAGEVYNIGGCNERTNIEIVKLICRELGKPESLIAHVRDRKGHDLRYAIDASKIPKELGWTPEVELRTESGRPSAGIWSIGTGGSGF